MVSMSKPPVSSRVLAVILPKKSEARRLAAASGIKVFMGTPLFSVKAASQQDSARKAADEAATATHFQVYFGYHISCAVWCDRSTIGLLPCSFFNCAVQAAAAAETSTLREQVKQLEALPPCVAETVSETYWHHCFFSSSTRFKESDGFDVEAPSVVTCPSGDTSKEV